MRITPILFFLYVLMYLYAYDPLIQFIYSHFGLSETGGALIALQSGSLTMTVKLEDRPAVTITQRFSNDSPQKSSMFEKLYHWFHLQILKWMFIAREVGLLGSVLYLCYLGRFGMRRINAGMIDLVFDLTAWTEDDKKVQIDKIKQMAPWIYR